MPYFAVVKLTIAGYLQFEKKNFLLQVKGQVMGFYTKEDRH